jgi:histidinol phosphatase-like PHP family hydrolase
MIDLHTHTIFSDGVLIPAELIRRAVAAGYRAIALTDHVDQSNIDLVIPRVAKAVKALRDMVPIQIMVGAELTHVPPRQIADMVKEARSLGAQLVVVHGETLVEPVVEGTNRAAIEAGVDILAHPGLITDDDLIAARERGVTLEITARKGHSLANGHVAKRATALGVSLTINTDAHAPADLITIAFASNVLRGAGLDAAVIDAVFQHAQRLVEKASGRA